MQDKHNKILLWIATTVVVVAYLFWGFIQKITGVDIYFIGIAFFIFLMSLYVFLNHKYTISFVLMCLAFGNIVDEICLNNTELLASEIIYVIIVLIASIFYNRYIKKLRNNRK